MKISVWEASQDFDLKTNKAHIRLLLRHLGDGFQRIPKPRPEGSSGLCFIYFPTGEEEKYKGVIFRYIQDQIASEQVVHHQLLTSIEELKRGEAEYYEVIPGTKRAKAVRSKKPV